jgi:hypothetical protein
MLYKCILLRGNYIVNLFFNPESFKRKGEKEGYRNQVSGFRNRERIKGKSK